MVFQSEGCTSVMIRFFDILAATCGLIVGSPLFLVLWLMGYLDTGKPLFWQERVGRYQQPFVLVKFRSMRPNTASLATHLANAAAITTYGRFLRRTKLDELPQLWNVLKGEMSLVGPRPNLFDQEELVMARQVLGVYRVRPGITGLAQINGIDMSKPELLARTDAEMISSMSLANYLRYVSRTIIGHGQGDRVHR